MNLANENKASTTTTGTIREEYQNTISRSKYCRLGDGDYTQ